MEQQQIKLVTVGDGLVGKTTLLMTYTSNTFPTDYIPTVFEGEHKTVTYEGTTARFSFWDTAGPEDYARLRPLSYPNTDIFLTCFSIVSEDSFVRVKSVWYPEVKHHCPNTPVYLVGMKVDLRDNEEMVKTLQEKNRRMISYEEGRVMAERCGFDGYFECSSLLHQGLDEIFNSALNLVVYGNGRPRSMVKRRGCVVM